MSTGTQRKGDSYRRQIETSRAFAEKNGLDLVEDADLDDTGISGYRGKNLASGRFGAFLEDVRAGVVLKGSYLLVESMDRLSRQAPAKALQPFLELINSGIVLVTMSPLEVFTEETLDFSRLLMALTIMQRSHEESEIKSHRLRSAWEHKRKQIATRKLTGRCPSWLELKGLEFEIVEKHASIVRRIFDDAANGLGTYTIVRRLNDQRVPTFTGKGSWQNSTVNKILSGSSVIGRFQPSKMVNGKRVPDGDPVEGYFPKIVTRSVFERAQRGRLERKTKPQAGLVGSGGPKGKHFTNLFSKLAICDYCGKPMYFQNKGTPPKGQAYLVCSTALRSSDCQMDGRWRYDQFEETFLKFVEQLDLASLVSSTEHRNRRSELAYEHEAMLGKVKRLEDEAQRAIDIGVKMIDFDSAILAARLKKIETELIEAKAQEQTLRHELAVLDETSLTYYSKPDQVAQLIERVRSRRGGDVYKLRAQIASRLQSLIKELRLTVDPDAQRFEAVFRDGHCMILFVDPNDPTKFVQKVSGKSPIFDLVNQDGEFIKLPMNSRAVGESGIDYPDDEDNGVVSERADLQSLP